GRLGCRAQYRTPETSGRRALARYHEFRYTQRVQRRPGADRSADFSGSGGLKASRVFSVSEANLDWPGKDRRRQPAGPNSIYHQESTKVMAITAANPTREDFESMLAESLG